MKANEFVEKFGLLRAKQILKYANKNHVSFLADGISTTYSYYDENMISINELKRLVESHELVEVYGGLESAKQCLLLAPYATDLEVSSRLKQAIADVESCQCQ